MSTFKQKLKSLLNDTSSLNDTSNVEKKFDQFFLRTYRKIKKDNTRQSISIFECKKTFPNDYRKVKKDLFLNHSITSGNKRCISPKIAERMAQTFSLMKNENSKNIYNDYKSGIFYNTINKFMDNSSKLKMKIQKGIDSFNKDKYKAKVNFSGISGINQSKNHFNSYIIKDIFFIKKNKTIYKTKKEISGESFRFNIRKGKLDFNNYFNQFRNRQKFINIDF